MTDPSAPTPAPKGTLTWGEVPSENERLLAVAAHLGMLVGIPFVVPIALYLWKKDESKFIAYHCVQSIALQVVVLVLGTVTCGVGLLLALGTIWGALKAYEGAWAGYPMLESFGREP